MTTRRGFIGTVATAGFGTGAAGTLLKKRYQPAPIAPNCESLAVTVHYGLDRKHGWQMFHFAGEIRLPADWSAIRRVTISGLPGMPWSIEIPKDPDGLDKSGRISFNTRRYRREAKSFVIKAAVENADGVITGNPAMAVVRVNGLTDQLKAGRFLKHSHA